jgi:DNA-binding response OmpR family regulator
MSTSSRGVALVVEDDEVLRELTLEILASGGWRAEGAGDLRAARACMTRVRADLLVLDLQLGGETSEELLAELAGCAAAPASMLVSASVEARDVALAYGVPFLRKPFDIDELLTLADAVVAQRRATRSLVPTREASRPRMRAQPR